MNYTGFMVIMFVFLLYYFFFLFNIIILCLPALPFIAKRVHYNARTDNMQEQASRTCSCRQHLQQKITNSTMTKVRDAAQNVYHQP